MLRVGVSIIELVIIYNVGVKSYGVIHTPASRFRANRYFKHISICILRCNVRCTAIGNMVPTIVGCSCAVCYTCRPHIACIGNSNLNIVYYVCIFSVDSSAAFTFRSKPIELCSSVTVCSIIIHIHSKSI